MTCRELRDFLNTLTEEQLEYDFTLKCTDGYLFERGDSLWPSLDIPVEIEDKYRNIIFPY